MNKSNFNIYIIIVFVYVNMYCAVLNIYHNKPEPKNPRMNKLKVASVNTKVQRCLYQFQIYCKAKTVSQSFNYILDFKAPFNRTLSAW